MRPQLPASSPNLLVPSLKILILVSLFVIPLNAQTSKPDRPELAISSNVKLVSIHATGSKRYSSADIAAATGLKVGQTASDDDFKQVSQRLGECGAFTTVNYSYRYAGDGAHLELHVVDAEAFVPASFENFVWFSDQELASKLREHIPLFRGSLPLTGTLPDQLSDALQLLLLEKKIPGHIEYLRAGFEGGPVTGFDYSVVGPAIRVRNIAFEGATPEDTSVLENLARQLQGKDYERSVLRSFAEKNFTPVFSARGYLKAAFSDAQARIGEETPEEIQADVTFPIVTGHQYKFQDIQWSGNKVFPADKLQSLIRMKPGEPFNSAQLIKGIEEVKKLYGTRGYAACEVRPTQQIDESQYTVRYKLEVQEGDVYHMGVLEIHGLDDPDSRKLIANWKIAKGDVYDSSYPARFLDEIFRTSLLDTSWETTTHAAPDPDDKTVDIELRFYRKAAQ